MAGGTVLIMKKLNLIFLWHMHQPFYKDGHNGSYHMPWVFLHAIKDYYEIPRYLKDYKGIRQTFNLVPSLLVQLKDYESVDVDDVFIKTLLKEPSALSSEEKCGHIPQLFMANFGNMIHPLRRYVELYSKNSRSSMFDNPDQLFSNEEILDLQVLYLLSWTGNYIRRDYPFISELIKKGTRFTQEEKARLLETLCESVKRIVPLYRELQEAGSIEVSCTPFYHPILPLLIDLDSAKEALPDISMPSAFGDFGSDAQFHVREAVKYYENTFGRKPNGMWPAEGSISRRAAVAFMENDIHWIASDEDVLSGSSGVKLSLSPNRTFLYNRHYFEENGKRINIFFRDKILSDLVGFTYSGWNAEKAADDFIHKLKVIYDATEGSCMVPVILDGENAWEYYPDNGELFFRALYERLEKEKWINTLTMSEAVNLHDVPEYRLENIRAGSWIYGNFTTWLGHSEKNEGWRLLSMTRSAVQKEKEPAKREKAMREIHIAEGSDWFWWFGDDHFSLQSDMFDKLFRGYLINAYNILELEVPQELYIPVKRTHKSGLTKKPNCHISPVTDGEVTSFFEWLGAGEFDLKFDSGAMHASSNVLRKLYFGYDDKALHLRLEGDISHLPDKGYSLDIELMGDENLHIVLPLKSGVHHSDNGAVCAFGRLLEVALPHDLLPAGSGRIYLVFRLCVNGDVAERAPLYNMVEVDLTDNFEDDWIV
jgi:alpha-amylase/alpha-mannosidase (GH57 family)